MRVHWISWPRGAQEINDKTINVITALLMLQMHNEEFSRLFYQSMYIFDNSFRYSKEDDA